MVLARLCKKLPSDWKLKAGSPSGLLYPSQCGKSRGRDVIASADISMKGLGSASVY